MPTPWSPRRARLTRSAAAGQTSLMVSSSFDAPGAMKIGTQVVTASGPAGVNQIWSVSPALSESHGVDSYIVEVTIKVLVNGQDQTALATNLHHREQCPEGELEATWDIATRTPSTYVPTNFDVNPVSFLLYSNESGAFLPFFGGHIGRIADSQYPNGSHMLHFTGRGNFITLGWRPISSSRVWTADTAGHVMVQDALTVYAPQISPTFEHILDGGAQIGETKDGIGQTVRTLVDWVASRGDADGQALDWLVRTDTDGTPKLWLIIRSREPVVTIPISSLKAPVTFAKDVEYVKTMVTVKWRDGYVSEPQTTSIPTTAVRGIFRDYANQIDTENMARQVALALYQLLSAPSVLSDGQLVIEHPKPVYVNGVPISPHKIRAGWMAVFTGWGGGFPLVATQIKSIDADHTAHTLSMSVGKIGEDDLDIVSAYVNKQTKILGSPMGGLIPNNWAPPEGVPQSVASNAISSGSSGNLNREKLGTDFDIAQSTYAIQGALDEDGVMQPIAAGRKFPAQKIEIGGRLLGFRLEGNDGVTPTPGPGTIALNVYRGHEADLPAIGTLIATTGITADVKGSTDLTEPTVTPAVGQIVDVTPGDYLVYEVDGDADAITNVSITILIQKTEGSSRAVSSGGPDIQGVTVTRSLTTGYVTFTVTTDRPSYVQISYGETANNYLSKSPKSEIVRKVTPVRVPNIASPFHYRVVATDKDGHATTSDDMTG